jgi:hypothetical protein
MIRKLEYPKEAIAFTHVGNIDDYLGDVTDIKLVDIKPNVNVSFSLSPIFHVMTHVSKDEMHFCIAYDSNVTPDNTAHTLMKVDQRRLLIRKFFVSSIIVLLILPINL